MKKIMILMSILIIQTMSVTAQDNLPRFHPAKVRIQADWLVDQIKSETCLFKAAGGSQLVLSNGIAARTFSIKPNGATIGLDQLVTGETFLRSVRPEAEIVIDSLTFRIGGLVGQSIHNYLSKEFITDLKTDPASFKLIDYRLEEIKARFPWKKRLEWMPKDLPWPPPGKELIFSYKLDDQAFALIPADSTGAGKYRYLKNVVVQVHYELYDGLPLFSKWLTIENKSKKKIMINSFKSEILAAVEPRNEAQLREAWMLPNITVQTDYDCGGGMRYELGEGKAYNWEIDPLYKTQINYKRQNPCLLVVKPEYGPAFPLAAGAEFESYRVWELIHSSRDREHKGLEMRRMFRTIAPWITENPVMMHARFADTESVKSVINQCAEVGFEKVILTFGSGFHIEDDSRENIQRMKMLADYAHARGVTLGGYSLLASRKVGDGNDVVSPEGMRPRFGNSPCLGSTWAAEYFNKLYTFYEKTGFDNLEHDGSYPGDICISHNHPGHSGLADSRWNQYQIIRNFYRWCRSKGVFLNVPDWYFLNGCNKVGMGYRETNWSLPRAEQEIIERQNIYDGTWFKTPSMGWMHVPLTQYHGGGEAAIYEPLKDHLQAYEQRLANLFGAGVQAAWRGRQLYDTDETRIVVKKWVDFYKKYRRILDGDIVHIRRADGRDYDAILHVDPTGPVNGLLMIYNPLQEDIKRTIKVDLYYTGLKDKAEIRGQMGLKKIVNLNRDYSVFLDVEIPAHSQTWFVIK